VFYGMDDGHAVISHVALLGPSVSCGHRFAAPVAQCVFSCCCLFVFRRVHQGALRVRRELRGGPVPLLLGGSARAPEQPEDVLRAGLLQDHQLLLVGTSSARGTRSVSDAKEEIRARTALIPPSRRLLTTVTFEGVF